MLPSSNTGAVNLYKSTRFPDAWEHVALLTNRSLIDASILFYDSRWWIVGIFSSKGRRILQALYSESLYGPYHDTPYNCKDHDMIVCAPNLTNSHHMQHLGRRPAGSMFIGDNGKIFRFVQSTLRVYGDRLDLYELTSGLHPDMRILDETLVHAFHHNFRSHQNIKPWNRRRYHHASVIKISTGLETESIKWVALVDGD